MKGIQKRLSALLLSAAALALPGLAGAEGAENASEEAKLKNGSFEENQNAWSWSNNNTQPDQDNVPEWYTTAFQGKIELFKDNTGTYVTGVRLKPTAGDVAAELNADEESTLYQIVKTEPSSLYEWGLDHGARSKSDTMALIIGPKQSFDPKKPSKTGRDQFMKMVDWLENKNLLDANRTIEGVGKFFENGIYNGGTPIILYSKKFGDKGTFEDSKVDDDAFSLTHSEVYSEKWCIWLMTDSCWTDGGPTEENQKVNPWGHYGDNATTTTQTENNESPQTSSKYYYYAVPEGQTKSIFAFVSVKSQSGSATLGNFLDGINFKLYRALSGTTTPNGTAQIIGYEKDKDKKPIPGSEEVFDVKPGETTSFYVLDGVNLKLKAQIAAEDKDNVEFVGVYYTRRKENAFETKFFANDNSWTKATDGSGNVSYTYDKGEVVSGAIHFHFVFVRRPVITYDPNGGKPYDCGNRTDSYSFAPKVEGYVEPYTSHAAEGQNAGWKFMGWKLFSDSANSSIQGLILPAVHTIACDYRNSQGETIILKQNFSIAEGKVTFTKEELTGDVGVDWWPPTDTATKKLTASGLSLVAQWRWKQTAVPRTRKDSQGYLDSNEGGTVSVVSDGAGSGEHYVYNENELGSMAYYSGVNERITMTASVKAGYVFDGWYDEDGQLVETNPSHTFVVGQGETKTFYARFSKKYTVTYKRQIEDGSSWKTLEDTDGTIEKLPITYNTESYGNTVSSTAPDTNTDYGFIGWYDAQGNELTTDYMLGTVIEGEATYYARYVKKITLHYAMQYSANGVNWSKLETSQGIGSLSSSGQTLTPGNVASSLATVSNSYYFVGWYNGDDGNAERITSSEELRLIAEKEMDGKTFYARFMAKPTDKVSYKVKHVFVNAKSSGQNDIVEETYYVEANTEVTPTQLADLRPWPGYRYTSGIITKTITDSTTVFELLYNKYTVLRYDPNTPDGAVASGSVGPTEGIVGENVVVSGNRYTVQGYTFQGWNTARDGNGRAYNDGANYQLGDTVNGINPNVLYAQWKANDDTEFTVEHYKLAKDGTKTLADSEKKTGKTGAFINAVSYVKSYTGYTFLTDKTQEASGYISGDGLLVLKLYYKPNSITLTYKPNGGVGDDKTISDIVVDERVALIANPFQRENYSFTGWNTQADGTGTGYQPNDLYWMKADVTHVLYAQWTEKDKTRLTYDANGGTGDMAAKEGYVDAKVKVDANQFNRSGYTFTGWNTQADGKGTEYDSGDDYTLLANVDNANPNKLYAQWKANTDTEYTVEHYKLSADKSQATKVEADTQTLYGTTDTEVDATRQQKSYPGYTYDAEKSEGTVKGVIRGDGALVLKLYYAPDETTLTYKPNYDCSDPDVVENNLHVDETVTLAGDLFTRAGYTLTGWNTQASGGGRAFMKGAQYTMRPNANSVNPNVLYAQWAANTTTPYTVEHHKLNSRGEVVSSEVEHLTGTTDTTVEAVVKYYPGYLMDPNHAEHKKEGVVTADGKLVLRLFYVPQSAVLIYKPNGGVGADVTQAGHVHEGVTIRENPFLRVGYAFTGWNTLPDGSGTAYAPGGEIMLVEGELILYAQWESVPPVITPEDADLPKTGDRTHLTVWLLLLAASSSLLLALVLSGGKRGRAAGGRCAAGQSRREDAT